MSEYSIEGALDLDIARSQRAAEREGKKQDMPLVVGGAVIATLPVELPVDVLAPLRSLDGDLTLILREAMTSAKAGGMSGGSVDMNVTNLIIDLLATNPRLPMNFLDTVRDVARNLLTQEGLDRLLENRLSGQDVAFLIKGVFSFYGVTLGEALPSSDSSTDDSGGTSSGTSSTTYDSTHDGSGETPATPSSSESVAS